MTTQLQNCCFWSCARRRENGKCPRENGSKQRHSSLFYSANASFRRDRATGPYNSCRNRHCPKCQAAAARRWLKDREAELLPVPYYHVVFTLPASIGAIAFHNKAAVYDLLSRAAADTLTTIAADRKHLGARIGLTGVLHTWGSALTHHPHVHVIVPGGGLSRDGSRWIACKP